MIWRSIKPAPRVRAGWLLEWTEGLDYQAQHSPLHEIALVRPGSQAESGGMGGMFAIPIIDLTRPHHLCVR